MAGSEGLLPGSWLVQAPIVPLGEVQVQEGGEQEQELVQILLLSSHDIFPSQQRNKGFRRGKEQTKEKNEKIQGKEKKGKEKNKRKEKNQKD